MIKENESLEASEWVKRGRMMLRREGLDYTDSESWFGLWHKKHGNLTNFPWKEFGFNNGPPIDFPWKLFGLNPFKECPNCGHKHEEGRGSTRQAIRDEIFEKYNN